MPPGLRKSGIPDSVLIPAPVNTTARRASAIRRACAEVLAEEGCDIVLVSRTAADLETVRAKLAGEHNVAVRYYALDLSDSKNVDRLAAECADTDILVNNAGAIPGGNIAQIDEARWREAWDLKVFGYINMTRRVLIGRTSRME